MDVPGVEPRTKIYDPEIKEIADRVLSILKLSAVKGAASLVDSERYPLEVGPDGLEKLTASYLRERPERVRDNAKRTIQQLLERPEVLVASLPHSFKGVDLLSSNPVMEQIEHLNLLPAVKFTHRHIRPFTVNEGSELKLLPARFEARIAHLNLDLRVIKHHIDQKYEELGSEDSFLGRPSTEIKRCPDGVGQFRHYEHGSIYWTPDTGAHAVHGPIREKWKSLGWETSFLGYPLTDERSTPDGRGRYNHFQNGSIYWTAETGAHEVHGAIRAKWAGLQWEKGYLGYPITDETTTPDTIGRYNHFEGGSIYWTPFLGAHAVRKEIRNEWENEGWEIGRLGYPISDTKMTSFGIEAGPRMPNAYINDFQGGKIIWIIATEEAAVEIPDAKLCLRIHKVKCIDETNPEFWGSDEIDLGGIITSVNDERVTKRSPFRVGSFDDGDRVNYRPPKKFIEIDLSGIPGWPKYFLASMALAEIDMGGFNSYLRNITREVHKLVKREVAKALEAAGAKLGAIFGGIGAIVGAIIGAAVAYIIDEFFAWIISLFDDDYFPVFSAHIQLPNVWHDWSGHPDSPEYSFWTRAHGGKYEVWYDWELVK